ncbi:MAG: SDR family NAD(P)-dependent oxidoreductase [Saprospiraceae bacterium]|nr:SDR family NAD(P)-dependent oxidoreductase [Saprospiraceae bacterium]
MSESSPEKVYTIVTGASMGLGKALAAECAARGRNLILVALPNEGLNDVADKLRSAFGVAVVCFETDLTGPEAPEKLAAEIKSRYRVNGLINNAGIGGTMPIDLAALSYLNAIIMLNIRALVVLVHQFIPELKTHAQSHILNVSSLAAFSPFPYKTIYPASKSFVLSFSRGLREELRSTPISVTSLNPGLILTNADVMFRSSVHGKKTGMAALSPEAIARIAISGMLAGKAVVIPGFFSKLSRLLMQLLPGSIQMRILANIYRKECEHLLAEKEAYQFQDRMNP